MIRCCAWCERVLGVKQPLSDNRVTHTICSPCAEELLPRGQQKMVFVPDITVLGSQSAAEISQR